MICLVIPVPEAAPVTKPVPTPTSIEELLQQIEEEVPRLPLGTDLGAYITTRHRQLGQLLAERIVQQRDDATSSSKAPQEADFPPSDNPH